MATRISSRSHALARALAVVLFAVASPSAATSEEPIGAAPMTASPGDGAGDAPALPRLTSIGVFTKIYAVPGLDGAHLGYVHYGDSVALRRTEPIRRADCPAGWYAIAPRGYVCNDTTVVLETEGRRLAPHITRLLDALAQVRPRDGGLPFRYALSLGTPSYGRVPSTPERERYEALLPASTRTRAAAGAADLAVPQATAEESALPPFLGDGALSPDYVGGRDSRFLRRSLPRGSFVSFHSTFAWAGRTWLVTPELSLIPAERVREVKASTFHGVQLGRSMALPLAWIRREARSKYRRVEGTDELVPADEIWAARSAVPLTGARVVSGGRVFLETNERGVYLDAADATVVSRSERRPRGVASGDKWVQISIGAGTLTAYEGDAPVFTTLISPGRGGAPPSGRLSNRQLVQHGASPLGTYRILYKERFSTMSPDRAQKTYFLDDVPHIQYFRGPFALHAAYWHDDFGEPKSGGCINLSPDDAARLFAWTDPPVPAGWHSAQSSKANGLGTRIEITR